MILVEISEEVIEVRCILPTCDEIREPLALISGGVFS
jgi:hypothetical protein